MERNELVRYLDRVKNSYPYGIPKEDLERAAQAASLASQPLCRVLFLVGSAHVELSPAEYELLDSIVEKGLSLPRGTCEVHVVCLTDGPRAIESVYEVVKEKRPEIAMALGLGLSERGSWTMCGVVPLLHTVPLAEISTQKMPSVNSGDT